MTAVVVVIVVWALSLVVIARLVRRRSLQEKKRRDTLIRALVETSSGVALVFDSKRRVVAANDDIRRHSGGSPTGRSVVEALGVADDSVAVKVLDDVMTAVLDGAPSSAELPDEEDDGSMRILEIEARPLEGGQGFLQVNDATERRERAMRSAQSERMEALGALAGGLAHDFNNLLFVTLGNLQLMATNDVVVNDEKLSKFVSRSVSAVERGAEITKSLLAVARSQPLEESAVTLADLVKGILPLVRQALGAGRTVAVDIPDQSVQLMLDAGRLSSCILNLAFNARDAMGPNGTLTIAAHRVDELDPTWGLTGSFIRLSITDDGSGMSDDVVARAFEPFFTTKKPGSGTGLGLATVYAFARQTGGTATLSSRLGVGTTVSLVLPVHDPSDTEATSAPRRRAGRRVVVADDEQSLAELVASWLIDVGVDARFATSPKAALEMVEEFAPDVLVSDANFGEEIDGIELAKLASAIQPDLAVIFMTGYSSSMRALQELGERTLAKPFSRDDLYGALMPYLAEASDV
ncbi:MAG: hypothetical protein RLZZ269_247 [Actinomycetota bacterium]